MSTLAYAFAPTPVALLGRDDVSRTAVVVYDVISTYRNRRNGGCFPKRETLAARVGVSVRTITRAISQLRSAGFLAIRKLPLSNAYELTTPDQWQAGEVDAERRDKNGQSAGTKMASLPGQKCPGDADPSLYEPDVSYPDERHDAAAGVSSHPGGAAAAATVEACNEPEHPSTLAVTEAEKLVVELMPKHPEPGNSPGAVAEAAKILTKAEDLTATLQTIREAHAACCQEWATYPAGRFIPRLPRWFRDGDWKHIRPGRKGVQSETLPERRAREFREWEERTYRMYAENEMWDALRENGGEELVEVWREKVKAAC